MMMVVFLLSKEANTVFDYVNEEEKIIKFVFNLKQIFLFSRYLRELACPYVRACVSWRGRVHARLLALRVNHHLIAFHALR